MILLRLMQKLSCEKIFRQGIIKKLPLFYGAQFVEIIDYIQKIKRNMIFSTCL